MYAHTDGMHAYAGGAGRKSWWWGALGVAGLKSQVARRRDRTWVLLTHGTAHAMCGVLYIAVGLPLRLGTARAVAYAAAHALLAALAAWALTLHYKRWRDKLLQDAPPRWVNMEGWVALGAAAVLCVSLPEACMNGRPGHAFGQCGGPADPASFMNLLLGGALLIVLSAGYYSGTVQQARCCVAAIAAMVVTSFTTWWVLLSTRRFPPALYQPAAANQLAIVYVLFAVLVLALQHLTGRLRRSIRDQQQLTETAERQAGDARAAEVTHRAQLLSAGDVRVRGLLAPIRNTMHVVANTLEEVMALAQPVPDNASIVALPVSAEDDVRTLLASVHALCETLDDSYSACAPSPDGRDGHGIARSDTLRVNTPLHAPHSPDTAPHTAPVDSIVLEHASQPSMQSGHTAGHGSHSTVRSSTLDDDRRLLRYSSGAAMQGDAAVGGVTFARTLTAAPLSSASPQRVEGAAFGVQSQRSPGMVQVAPLKPVGSGDDNSDHVAIALRITSPSVFRMRTQRDSAAPPTPVAAEAKTLPPRPRVVHGITRPALEPLVKVLSPVSSPGAAARFDDPADIADEAPAATPAEAAMLPHPPAIRISNSASQLNTMFADSTPQLHQLESLSEDRRLDSDFQYDYGFEHQYKRRPTARAITGRLSRRGLGTPATSASVSTVGARSTPILPALAEAPSLATAASAANAPRTLSETLSAAGVCLAPTRIGGALTDASMVIMGSSTPDTPAGGVPPSVSVTTGDAAANFRDAASESLMITRPEHESSGIRDTGPDTAGDAHSQASGSDALAAASPAASGLTEVTPIHMRRAESTSSDDGSGDPSFRFGLHVLVVDDEKINRRIAVRMLQRLGCTAHCVEDGDEIIGALVDSERPYDLILLDIIMKRTNGLEVCRSLREQHIDIPIIAATGAYASKESALYRAAGFDRVLTKPFTHRDMAAALTQALGIQLGRGAAMNFSVTYRT